MFAYAFLRHANSITIIVPSYLLLTVLTLCIFVICFQIRTLTMGKYQTSVVYVSLDEKWYWYWICRKHTINIILRVQHIYLYLVPLLHLASISIPAYNFPYLHNFNSNQNKLPLIFTTGVRLDILLSVCMVYAVSCYSVPERDSKCKLNEYPMLLSYRIYSMTFMNICSSMYKL